MAYMMQHQPSTEDVNLGTISICSDPLVIPSKTAPKDVHAAWFLHGHPLSTRYSNPTLISLADLVRHNGEIYKGKTAFLYPTSGAPYESMTWDEFDSITESIALSYGLLLKAELEKANQARKQPTVALLGGGTTLEYFCTQLALMKLGVRVLLLAEGNALKAIQHLLESCRATAIITDRKNANVDARDVRKLDMIEILPEYDDDSITSRSLVDSIRFDDDGDVWERHTFIIHSSGSTGMPKPIIHTNRSMMLIARMYRLFQEFNVENWFILFPMYHIAGISVALCSLPLGKINSFPPLSWPPSSSSILGAWETMSKMGYPVDCTHCAPTFIENMYEYILENGGDFTPLTSLKVLQPGGAALSDSTVKSLEAKGVNMKTTYGSTEMGPVARSLPQRNKLGCYSFRNLYPDNPFLKFAKIGENSYECIVYKGFELAAELWDGKPDNEPYRSNDLFIEEPQGSGFFVLHGRMDDILVHSNGEKTKAGPLQLDIQTAGKAINTVVALGNSKPCVSLLVELRQGYDTTSQSVRDLVWNTVREVNSQYPKHSQVMQSMIYILPKGASLPVTPKGNVKRKEAESLYAKEIERLYSQDYAPSNFTHEQSLPEFLRNSLSSLSNIPPSTIQDWTTFSDLGIDSRLAVALRSSLSTYLNRSISLSTIFENPSISKLVKYFSRKLIQESSNGPETSSLEIINRIISRFESEFKSWPPRSSHVYPSATKQTILLTGASGSLGAALLESLTASADVERIYAMVRGPNQVQKLRNSFINRGLNPEILNKGGKIEVLNFSMKDPLLGLDIETYHELATSVTIVIQNAWKMDLNLGVEEFVDDCIKNTMSLLRLCHTGRPKTMAFMSSVAACLGTGHTAPTVPEEPISSDPSAALRNGYAQSKYIIERLTQTINCQLSIPIRLLRIGQLCGSTTTGHWSTSDMWPILFSISLHPQIQAFPSMPNELVDWIPVNIAASCISSLLLTPSATTYSVHNIVNPHPISWDSMLSLLQTCTSLLPIMPVKEWTKRLAEVVETIENETEVPVRGLTLPSFFEEMAKQQDRGASGNLKKAKVFETKKTEGVCAELRECRAVDGEWVERWVGSWRKEGFV